MNKYTILSLFVLLAAVSCQRESGLPGDEAPVKPEDVSTGIVPIQTGFRATLPGKATKTSVNMANGIISWTTDDPIWVSNGTEDMLMYVEEGGRTQAALYALEDVFDGNHFYAVYPAADGNYSQGTFQTAIPSTQSYVKEGFATQTFPMVAICDGQRNFAFRNAASLLKIVIESDFFNEARIQAVNLTANEPMTGILSVNYSEGGEPLPDCSAGEKNLTLLGPEAGIPMGEPVYVVVAPGDYTGLQVRITLNNGMDYSCPVEERISVNRSAYREIRLTLQDKYKDLSAQETANCYFITEPGSYKFRADIKGNGAETSCGLPAHTEGLSGVKLYYSDGAAFLSGGFALIDNYIYFSTVEGVLPSGTALVSAVDENGTTRWSWHIWANSDIADVELSDGTVWLNMNLGAHQLGFNTNGYNGYYYQWGRKDPFLQRYTTGASTNVIAPFVSHASATDGSLENSITNPHIFYGGYHPSGTTETTEDWSTYEDEERVYDWWNKDITGDKQNDVAAAKTMFDPCPPGYHVPVYADLQSLLDLTQADSQASSGGRTVEGKLFFPYTSYRYISIYAAWWPGGSEASRIFIPSSTPYETTTKTHRRFSRMYMTSSPSQGLSNGIRSYAVPVRCIKVGAAMPVPVSSVQLDAVELQLLEGETHLLTATVLPEDASEKSVTWSSSNPSVATVSNGLVTAMAQGTATISANASGHTATCEVTVSPAIIPAVSLTLNKTSLKLAAGGQYTLVPTILPSDASNKNVIWETSNAAVATVENGTITAIAGGAATITARLGSLSATCTVTVQDPGSGSDIEDMNPDDWN